MIAPQTSMGSLQAFKDELADASIFYFAPHVNYAKATNTASSTSLVIYILPTLCSIEVELRSVAEPGLIAWSKAISTASTWLTAPETIAHVSSEIDSSHRCKLRRLLSLSR